MLSQLTSEELTEWQAYFKVKEKVRKDAEDDAKLKARNDAKATRGFFKKR